MVRLLVKTMAEMGMLAGAWGESLDCWQEGGQKFWEGLVQIAGSSRDENAGRRAR